MIVDEEQRFGVEHEERIEALRTYVGALTMSATPISRTLEVSLTGIREMSTILIPPGAAPDPDLRWGLDGKQGGAAVRRELLRDAAFRHVCRGRDP